jgi:hypothetical protein
MSSAAAETATASAAALADADPFLLAAAQWALLGAAAYALLFALSSRLSPRLFRASYPRLPAGDRADWDSRVPSTLHACAAVALGAALALGGAFSPSLVSDAAAADAAAAIAAGLDEGGGLQVVGDGGGADDALGAAAAMLASTTLWQSPAEWADVFFHGGGPSASDDAVVAPSLRASLGSYAALGLSAGYFAADAVAMALFPPIGSAPMYAHHAVALASLAAALAARAAHAPVLAVLASEATTPFVNVRFWLDRTAASAAAATTTNGALASACSGIIPPQQPQQRGFWYAANGLALALAWFLCREAAFVALFGWLRQAWPEVEAAGLPLYARAMLVGVPVLLLVLNTLWFVKIVKGARKLVGPFREGVEAAARRVGFFPGARRKAGAGKARTAAAARQQRGSNGALGMAPLPSASATITARSADKAAANGGGMRQHHHQYKVDVVAVRDVL